MDWFNVVILNDVIEHILKVKMLELLKLVFNALKPGGKVFIKTENMGNPFNQKIRYGDFSRVTGFTENGLYQFFT